MLYKIAASTFGSSTRFLQVIYLFLQDVVPNTPRLQNVKEYMWWMQEGLIFPFQRFELSTLLLFELRFRHTDITALQPYLCDSGASRKGAARQITNKIIVHITTQRVSLNSAKYGTSAKQLPLHLTTTSNSHRLFPTAHRRLSKWGGAAPTRMHRMDQQTVLVAGENCPHVSLTISHSNCLVTRPNNAFALIHWFGPLGRLWMLACHTILGRVGVVAFRVNLVTNVVVGMSITVSVVILMMYIECEND